MKKNLLPGSAFVATLAALASCSQLPTSPPLADDSAHAFTVLPARPQSDATHTVQSGQVGAGDFGPLLARTHGYVRNVFVAGGDYVQPGQLLAKLDNHTFVTAPRAGFVSALEVHVGQHIEPATRITTLSAYRYLVVQLVLPRLLRPRLHLGDSARVWVAGRAAAGLLRARPAGVPGDSVLEVVLSSRAPFRLGEAASVRLPIYP